MLSFFLKWLYRLEGDGMKRKLKGGAVMAALLGASLLFGSCFLRDEGAGRQEEQVVSEVRLKAMSFNIHSGIGEDGVYDLNRIESVIRESGAEVIGLQEVDAFWSGRSRFEHQARQLGQRLGMHSFFAPIYDLPPEREGEPNRQFGVAILSKHPILEANNRDMTRLSTQTRDARPEPAPGLAEVLLDVQGVMLKVYAVHLDYRPDAAVRARQVKELLSVMAENEYDKIVLGDFNARMASPELAPLFPTLYDTWARVRKEPGHTFPAEQPNRKIDAILATRGIETVSADVVQSLASDHRPVVAEAIVKRQTAAE